MTWAEERGGKRKYRRVKSPKGWCGGVRLFPMTDSERAQKQDKGTRKEG